MTLHASCGYREKRKEGEVVRPANWCHFWIKSGEVEMCGDSQCPGGSGAIP